MTERFNRAFNALTTSYFEGTLFKGHCGACAVGNIVAAGMGINIDPVQILSDVKEKEIVLLNDFWKVIFITTDDGVQEKNFGRFSYAERHLLKVTGYSAQELAQVEFAFERNTTIWYNDQGDHSEQTVLEDQYNGLAAVIEVLCKLDGIESIAEHKAEFRKHPKFQVVI